MGFVLTTIRVIIGLLVLTIGVWGRFDQTARKQATEGALGELQQSVADGLPSLSPDQITDAYDGQPVFIQGEIIPTTVTDPLTGLTLTGTRLARGVELKQWKENVESTRVGSSNTSRSYRYWYDRVWSRQLIDSDSFHEPYFGGKERENPKTKPFEDKGFMSDPLMLGSWKVSPYDFGLWFGRVPVTAEFLNSAELNPDWQAEDQYLYLLPEKTVRVMYELSTFERQFYSLIAIPENGRLQLNETLAPVKLIAQGNVEPKAIVEAAGGTVPQPQTNWIYYTFFGLMLLIRPVARRFSALNNFSYAPAGKRIATTAGIAAAITAMVWILSLM